MILVDSSVWIDFLRGISTLAVRRLKELFTENTIAIPDLVLAEVLQGVTRPADVALTTRRLLDFPIVATVDRECALQAAQNYRVLRTLGVTVRSTIDTLIATRCLLDGHALLYSDRDFDPFVEHLGLRPALTS